MAAAVELAAERDRLAALKLKKQALEQQLAAAAARDADACAAAARAMAVNMKCGGAESCLIGWTVVLHCIYCVYYSS